MPPTCDLGKYDDRSPEEGLHPPATFSDFDPSGMQMPVSIAVKLMAQQALHFPDFEFIVQPVALTLEDVIRLRLPTAMVDKKDARRNRRSRRH
jgi:hypothetical protein